MRHRIPPLVALCALVGGIALVTACVWLVLTRSRVLSPAGVVACTAISVAVALAIEHVARLYRRRRTSRTHARPRLHRHGRKVS